MKKYLICFKSGHYQEIIGDCKGDSIWLHFIDKFGKSVHVNKMEVEYVSSSEYLDDASEVSLEADLREKAKEDDLREKAQLWQVYQNQLVNFIEQAPPGSYPGAIHLPTLLKELLAEKLNTLRDQRVEITGSV